MYNIKVILNRLSPALMLSHVARLTVLWISAHPAEIDHLENEHQHVKLLFEFFEIITKSDWIYFYLTWERDAEYI